MVDGTKHKEKEGLLSFPAYRSPEWLEENRLMPAVEECLKGILLQPKSLTQYSHIRTYTTRVANVRLELRNALFRQALFKIQNIEVESLKNCKNDRVLLDIMQLGQPSYLPSFLRSTSVLSKELWLIDRCGKIQTYKVVYHTEGEDGFYCKVYPRSIGNLLRFTRYYLSL